MKAKKYNKEFQKYESVEVSNECSWYATDMDKKVVCPECGKTFKFGNGYTSQVYYSPNGFWGLIVCEACHNKEMRE